MTMPSGSSTLISQVDLIPAHLQTSLHFDGMSERGDLQDYHYVWIQPVISLTNGLATGEDCRTVKVSVHKVFGITQ